MSILKEVESKQLYMGKLRHGADLLEEITGICKDRGVRLGRVEAIGAVSKACIGYYNQGTRAYEFHTLDEPLEILSLTGNISVKDGEPMVHAHVTLADRAGNAFGGHLAAGTVVFACEWMIEVFRGPAFERGYDEDTGLPLWTMEE